MLARVPADDAPDAPASLPSGARRPRVVVLDHTAELGGAELALVRLLDAVGASAEVHVVLFAAGPLADRLASSGHRVEVLPLSPAVGRMGRAAAGTLAGAAAAVRTLPFVWRLARRIRELDPDVVHTTSLKADLLGAVAARIARRPLVWHVHDRLADDYLAPRVARTMRWLATRVPDVVIANSAATARTVDAGWPRTDGGEDGSAGPARALVVAHPGLAPGQVLPAPRPAAPTPPVVGIVGRISPTKDQLSFVRAAALVAAAVPDVRFRIVGAPLFGQEDYAELVRREADALGLTDRVEWTGFVADPTTELDRLTVCVHAASVPEPFGQVVAEAMARSVAVVATTGGGVDEILEPGTDGQPLGWIVQPGDPQGIADAVVQALTQPEEAQARAEAGWRSVRQRFTAEHTAHTVLDAWQRAARARRGGQAGQAG